MKARELAKYNPDDIVEVRWRGRPFLAVIVDTDARQRHDPETRVFKVAPITRNISARFVEPDEVSGHWLRRNGGQDTLKAAVTA